MSKNKIGKQVAGSKIMENMSKSIFMHATNHINRLSKDPNGSTRFQIDALFASIDSGSELAVLNHLPARTISDSIWKPSVRDEFKAKNHFVADQDCSSHDTIECGYKWEYKIARWSPSKGLYVASNTSSHPQVRLALFVADGPSLKDCGLYIVNNSSLRKFTHFKAKNKGWQFALSSNELKNEEGFGFFRLSFAQFAQKRMDVCACK